MPIPETRRQVAAALEAVNNKKAEDVTLLQLPRESSTFTDYFLICSGHNPRQVQAIADEVDERLSKGLGVEPNNREGYDTAEWVLLDYVDFVVHIFNAQRRAYYDLERLWKSAQRLTAQDLERPHRAPEVEIPARKPPAKGAKKKSPSVRAGAKQTARGAAKRSAVKRSGASRSGQKVAAKKSSAGRPSAKKKSR